MMEKKLRRINNINGFCVRELLHENPRIMTKNSEILSHRRRERDE